MKRKLSKDERGMVAIIVTMIMMFVITLIVLGFSENTRRNQREALDTQLGIQAYYAAETGVNDMTKAIKAAIIAGSPISNHSDCSTITTLSLPRKLKADDSVANTCLMVETNPKTLFVDKIAVPTDSVEWKVSNAAGRKFETLTFSWSPDSGSSTCSTGAVQDYPKVSKWNCDRALLRVDILPANVGSTDAATLASKTSTLFLKPVAGSGQGVTIKSFGTPVAHQGACKIATPTPSNPGCSVTLTLDPSLDPSVQTTDYYVRLTAQYATANNVTLSGTDSAGGARFKDGQVVIDSTGRAQDQLKRIRVRIPLGESNTALPVFAVQSKGTVCKDILISGTKYFPQQCASYWP